MKRYLFIALALLTSLILKAHPLTGLLERIDKGASKRIAFDIKDDKSGKDYFELSQKGSKPLIRANNYVNAAVGLNWYLKYYCGVHLSWNCMKSNLPATLPAIEKTERHETDLTLRYDFNYCTFSYSMAFWDWERWQTEIDWMALHGINMPLAAVGHECVWRNMLLRMGYSEEEIGKFIAGPAFLAWWEMNNLEGWGGPLPLNWYKQQETLQKKILARMKEYGMHPVLPGYSGMKPSDEIENGKLKIENSAKQNEKEDSATEESSQSSIAKWNGFTRPGVIFPNDPQFDEYARLFYEETAKLYGKVDYYSIDPFHEAKNLPEDLDIGAAGKKIMQMMKQYGNSDAKWVLQGWSENPREEMIAAIEPGDLLILDLFSECRPKYGDPNSVWYQEKGYLEHDWMFCLLENFGANVGMHGRIDQLLENYYNARANFNKHLKGWGLTMEGSETNPIMYELMSELPWRSEKIDKQEWVGNYITARYGMRQTANNLSQTTLNGAQTSAENTDTRRTKPHQRWAVTAWNELARTILNCPRGNNQQGPSESIFCSRPSLNSYQASSWSKMVPYYSAESTINAAMLMTRAATAIEQSWKEGQITDAAWDNFQYDLVDICRQAIADRARQVYHQAMTDFKNYDALAFHRHSQQFLGLLLLQDSLLATRAEFRVGHWTEQAKRIAQNDEEARLYEWNARVQITTWGNRYCADTGKLRDYAHKEWNGLLKDFYYKRWAHFFDILGKELAGELPMSPIGNSSTKTDTNPAFAIDWYSIEEPWTLDQTPYPDEAEGNVVVMAKRVIESLSPASPKGRSLE